jgi:hypothetical protein
VVLSRRTYRCFGLWVSTDVPIGGLWAGPETGDPDVVVHLASPHPRGEIRRPHIQAHYVSLTLGENGLPNLSVMTLDDGTFWFRYADHTQFFVDPRGREVWATWPDRFTVEDAATYLLGPVLGFVLRLRGVTSLHASAVRVGNRAFAIVGQAGAGKSTTAAAFALRGYQVLADDVLPIVDEGGHMCVVPAYPRLRLWPESVSILFGSHHALPRLTPTWDKRYMDVATGLDGFSHRPARLGAVYVLSSRSNSPVAPFVGPAVANPVVELSANTYVNYLLDKPMRAREFAQLCGLVEQVPVRSLVPHADGNRIPDLCDAILRHFNAIKDVDPVPITVPA